MEGDPINRKLHNGCIARFYYLAKRGTEVEINQKVTKTFTPYIPLRNRISFKMFITYKYNAKYCDEPGVKFLGKLIIDLPGLGILDKLIFEFNFGELEMKINVKNETSGEYYNT